MKSRSPSPPNQMAKLNSQMSGDEETKSDGGEKKLVAKAHMSFIKPLSPYNQNKQGFFKMPGSPGRSSSPQSFGSGSGSNDNIQNINMSEEAQEAITQQIPLANFKSNHVSKKEIFIDTNAVMDDGTQNPNMGSPS